MEDNLKKDDLIFFGEKLEWQPQQKWKMNYKKIMEDET